MALADRIRDVKRLKTSLMVHDGLGPGSQSDLEYTGRDRSQAAMLKAHLEKKKREKAAMGELGSDEDTSSILNPGKPVI